MVRGRSAVFMGCWYTECAKENPRNGKRGVTRSAFSCKEAYKAHRRKHADDAATEGAAPVPATVFGDVMPKNMWVSYLTDILGERCCEPHKMSKKQRKNGPRSAARQQFLVRGTFLEEDGDSDGDDHDDTPEPNTFWVDKDVLLDTISKDDVKESLRLRHEAVCGDL